jgi:hypothetical protein
MVHKKMKDNILAAEKRRLVENCRQKIHTLYLIHCDNTEPVHWLAQHVAHVLITEMWFKLYGEESLSGGSIQQTEAIRDQLFLTAIDIVDTPRRIRQEPQAEQWKWLLRGYFQFLPMAFLLSELSRRQNFESLDHAWEVAEHAFSRWTDEDKDSKSGRILRDLMARAKANREQQMLIWPSSDLSFAPQRLFDQGMTEFPAASTEGARQREPQWLAADDYGGLRMDDFIHTASMQPDGLSGEIPAAPSTLSCRISCAPVNDESLDWDEDRFPLHSFHPIPDEV